MSTKHTPGPWTVTESSDWTGMSGVSLGIDDAAGQDGERDYHLATVVHGDPDELAANARLIASAPELMQALQEAENALDDYVERLEKLGGQMNYGRKVLMQARAAIAKATGSAA